MKLATKTVEKVWGRRELPAPFSRRMDEPVGEIWFEPPAELGSLLVKYLFTSEKLSVQVHPSDAEAGRGKRGKEECWLILDAEPGASLAIGFKEPVSADAMRAAALDGSIEHLLEWHEVEAGDFYYLPAGTVHAIGPGLTLVEVQQNSDITYRLYDYGRPRELHLDEAVRVADGGPYSPSNHRNVPPSTSATLVDGPHFRLDQVLGEPDEEVRRRYAGRLLVLPLDRPIGISGEEIAPGECGLVESLREIAFPADGRVLLMSPLSEGRA